MPKLYPQHRKEQIKRRRGRLSEQWKQAIPEMLKKERWAEYFGAQAPGTLPHHLLKTAAKPGKVLKGEDFTPQEAIDFALLSIGGGSLSSGSVGPSALGINRGAIFRALKQAGASPEVQAVTKSVIKRMPKELTQGISKFKIDPSTEYYGIYYPSDRSMAVNPFLPGAERRVPRTIIHEGIHHKQQLTKDKPWQKPLDKISEDIDPVQHRWFPETKEDWLVGAYYDPLEAQAHQLSKELTKKLVGSRGAKVSGKQFRRRFKQTAKRVEKGLWKKFRIEDALLKARGKSTARLSTGKINKLSSTEEAVALGKKATPEQLKQLRTAREESLGKQAKLKQAKDFQGLMDEATRGQFFREALEEAGRKKLKK